MLITVAAAQIACRAGELDTNQALHLDAIKVAAGLGVDLLVFPELSLSDYVPEPDPARASVAADGPELAELAAAAGSIVCLVGFMERNAGGRPFNACAVLGEGRVLGIHRKLNLPTYGALVEGHHYAAGERLDAVDTRLGRVATLICADTWNPALPWLAALGGADILAVPIASARGAVAAQFDSRENWTLNLRHTAMTYGLPTIMANHVGGAGRPDFWGGSAIFDANGRELARAGESDELIVAVIDLDEGQQARARLPTVRDADPPLIRRELDRRLRAAAG